MRILDPWVLITGSSKGLGRALAVEFSKHNYNIILHGRNKMDLERIAREASNNDIYCETVVGDLRLEETLNLLCSSALSKNLFILINNAAVTYFGLFDELLEEQIEEVFQTNLFSTVKLTRRLYPLLVKNKGILVFINSVNATMAEPEKTIYCSSKAGLKGFADSLRMESKRYGVKVMSVYPRGMNTPGYAGKNRKNTVDPLIIAEKIYRACHSTPIQEELFTHTY